MITEACFQKTPLAFAADTQTLRYPDPAKDKVINATVVKEGGGKGWMRWPFPNYNEGQCDYVVRYQLQRRPVRLCGVGTRLCSPCVVVGARHGRARGCWLGMRVRGGVAHVRARVGTCVDEFFFWGD